MKHFRGDAGRHKALHLSTHVRSMQIMCLEGKETQTGTAPKLEST